MVGDAVIGYYTLAVGQVSREEAPERLTKGLARHPIPIMLLARLAVDRRWHGQRVGKALLKEAMQRTIQAAGIAPASAPSRPHERPRGKAILREIRSHPIPYRSAASLRAPILSPLTCSKTEPIRT
jgi:GNAT superfamily N-acetyltransferase